MKSNSKARSFVRRGVCKDTAMIQEDVPGEVKELLERQQLNGVPVLLSTTSDLSLQGDLRGHWIVVTRDHLAVVADGAEPRLVNHLPIARVEKFRTQGAIGSGFLQAYVEEAWVDVARYSNTLAPRFHLLADKLEDLRTKGEVIVHPEEQLDKTHCAKCGMRLAAAGESCPRCLPRKAIAARLWQLMRPQWPTALAMFGLMLVGVVMELAPPKLQQYLVDEILGRGQAAPNAQALLASLVAGRAGARKYASAAGTGELDQGRCWRTRSASGLPSSFARSSFASSMLWAWAITIDTRSARS